MTPGAMEWSTMYSDSCQRRAISLKMFQPRPGALHSIITRLYIHFRTSSSFLSCILFNTLTIRKDHRVGTGVDGRAEAVEKMDKFPECDHSVLGKVLISLLFFLVFTTFLISVRSPSVQYVPLNLDLLYRHHSAPGLSLYNDVHTTCPNCRTIVSQNYALFP